MKRKRQILFDRNDPPIVLLEQQIRRMPRCAVVLWALEMAQETVDLLTETYPTETRPRDALELTRLWAAGKVKMPVAKRAILACHAAAKEMGDAEAIAHFHAVGQVCGTVHAIGHAVGYPIYDLTALIRRYGIEAAEDRIDARCLHYMEQLQYWETHFGEYAGEWADFL